MGTYVFFLRYSRELVKAEHPSSERDRLNVPMDIQESVEFHPFADWQSEGEIGRVLN